jgi:ABC-type polysaccharide/polyol phosphate export permease
LTVKKLILLNPMGQASQDARYAVVSHQSVTIGQVFNGGWYKFIPYLITLVFFVGGLLYFKSQAKSFAENI